MKFLFLALSALTATQALSIRSFESWAGEDGVIDAEEFGRDIPQKY